MEKKKAKVRVQSTRKGGHASKEKSKGKLAASRKIDPTEYVGTIVGESDRGCLLVGLSQIDSNLKDLLRHVLGSRFMICVSRARLKQYRCERAIRYSIDGQRRRWDQTAYSQVNLNMSS